MKPLLGTLLAIILSTTIIGCERNAIEPSVSGLIKARPDVKVGYSNIVNGEVHSIIDEKTSYKLVDSDKEITN